MTWTAEPNVSVVSPASPYPELRHGVCRQRGACSRVILYYRCLVAGLARGGGRTAEVREAELRSLSLPWKRRISAEAGVTEDSHRFNSLSAGFTEF